MDVITSTILGSYNSVGLLDRACNESVSIYFEAIRAFDFANDRD